VESSFEVANWTTSFESGTYLCHSGGVGWNLTSNDLEEWAAGFIVEHKYRNISTDPFVIELHTVATGPLSQGSPMRRVVSHAIERSTPYKCTTYSLGEWAFCKADTAEVHLLVREPGFGLVHGGVGGDPRGDVSIYDGAKLQLTTMTGEGVLNGRGDILLTPSDAYPLIEFRLSGVTKGRIWCQLNNAYMVYDGGIGAVNHQFVDSVLVTTSAGIQRFAVGNTATTINGFLNHAGSRVGFYGTTPAPRVNGTPEAATDLHSVIALANALRTTILSVGLAV
jgi:hypothetical protein